MISPPEQCERPSGAVPSQEYRSLDRFMFGHGLLIADVLAVPIAFIQRQIGAAILMAGSAFFPIRHMRFTALFSIVIVVVGGTVLTSFVKGLKDRTSDKRFWSIASVAVVLLLTGLAIARATNIITDRAYLSGTNLASFGAGLSWWFPEGAAALVEGEDLRGQIFSSASEGGYVAFRLGRKYQDYIDSRAIPFGVELMQRSAGLKATPPDSVAWKEEAERYNINVILLPIGRCVAVLSGAQGFLFQRTLAAGVPGRSVCCFVTTETGDGRTRSAVAGGLFKGRFASDPS